MLNPRFYHDIHQKQCGCDCRSEDYQANVMQARVLLISINKAVYVRSIAAQVNNPFSDYLPKSQWLHDSKAACGWNLMTLGHAPSRGSFCPSSYTTQSPTHHLKIERKKWSFTGIHM